MIKSKKSFFLMTMMIFGFVALLPAQVTPVKATEIPLIIWYDNSGHYGDTEDDVALMLKTQLDAAGFDVELKSTDWSTYVGQLDTMPIYLLGWWYDYPSEENYIAPFVGQSGNNYASYDSSVMDGYISTMTTTDDDTVRGTAMKDAQKLMAEDAPVIPLFTMTNQFIVYGSDITGVVLEPSENLHFSSLKKGASAAAISLGTTDSITTLDPADAYDYFSSNTLVQLTHGLFEMPIDGTSVNPVIIKDYKVSTNGLTYTFNIKSGLTFSDGTDVTSADVIWSLNRSTSLPGDPQWLLDGIDNTSWTEINSTALSFDLEAKDALFLNKLLYTNGWVFKEDPTVTTALQGKPYVPTGLGPYTVSSWTVDEEIVFTPNTNYASTELGTSDPANTQVTVKFFTTSANLKTAVETGSVDIGYHTFLSDEITALEASTDLETDSKNTAGIRYIVINSEINSDKTVRQAISYAIDRSEFVETIFAGSNSELYSMVPSVFDNACVKGDDCAFPGQDLAKVSSLLAHDESSTMSDSGSESSSSVDEGSAPGFELITLLISVPLLAILVRQRRKE